MGKGHVILTADDNEAFCYTTCRALEQYGFSTIPAHTGNETLRLAREHKPSLVILDVNMPDLNGYEVCRRLKAEDSTCNIPIIFLSATYHSNHAKDMGIAAGADAFLFAPIEPAQLTTVVQGTLAKAAGGGKR
jgi:CheY-like chemotaxis protein